MEEPINEESNTDKMIEPYQSNEEDKIDEMVETHLLFAKATEKAMDLQVADNFLSAVERQFLQTSPTPFDLEPFKITVDKLKKLPQEISLEKFQQVERQINKELILWQNTLGERSKKLETYHLRRYCDSNLQMLDMMDFASLTRFYWSLPHSPSNQSKFDLFVTRLFTKEIGKQPREILLEREELTKHLNELFDAWGDHTIDSKYGLDDLQANIESIDEFISEAKSFGGFEELVKSNLFERFRAFKLVLGKQMYVPQITAATIEYNIIVGNIFSELLAKANESIGEKFIAQFDFTGAFHDTSPSSQSHTSKILKEIRSKASKPEDKELTHIWTLLELVCVENETSDDSTEEKTDSDEVNEVEDTPGIQERLLPYLLTLSQPEPDTELLSDYIQKHDALADIDLNDFLSSKDENENLLLRNILGVIFWIHEICTHELAEKKEISQKLKVELQNILQKSQTYSDYLDKITETSDIKTKPYLFDVSSKFSGSRLKLKQSIVRLSNRNIESFYVQETEPKAKRIISAESSKSKSSINIPKIVKSQTNRWLIAATLFVAIFSGALYFFEKQISSGIPNVNSKSKINIATLPENEYLQEAYLQRNTLFITAKESWITLPKRKQHQGMKKILDSDSNSQFNTVVFVSSDGQFLDDMAKDVPEEEKPQVAENNK